MVNGNVAVVVAAPPIIPDLITFDNFKLVFSNYTHVSQIDVIGEMECTGKLTTDVHDTQGFHDSCMEVLTMFQETEDEFEYSGVKASFNVSNMTHLMPCFMISYWQIPKIH